MSNVGLRNPHGKTKTESAELTDLDTDASGQFTYTFGGLRRILGENPQNVDAHAAAGYVINCVSVTGNEATFQVHEGIGGSSVGELPTNTESTDLTDAYLSAEGL